MKFFTWIMRIVNTISVVVLLVIAIALGIFYVSDHSLELIHNEGPAASATVDPTRG